MNADDISKILMMQAIEEVDAEDLVVSAKDKRDAAGAAGAPLSRKLRKSEEDRFLSDRARALLKRVLPESPEKAAWWTQSSTTGRFRLLGLGSIVLAAIAGFLTNELGPEKRINILSFPLLGIILWSLAVYLREAIPFFRRQSPTVPDGVMEWLASILHQRPSPPPDHPEGENQTGALERAHDLFEARWLKLNQPASVARLKALLHIAAFTLAASAVAGMYVKGLANEYLAVWESTFFADGARLRPFLHFILGPAAALTGSTLPDGASLDSIRWSASGNGATGENAARWIHWYALTIGLYVLVPRALLAFLWRVRAARLSRALPFRSVSPRYFEHLLATSSGTALAIRLVPYAYEPDDTARRTLVHRLEDHFARAMEPVWAPPIPFGEEADFTPVESEETEILPVFNFASTPERETHLAVYHTLSRASPNPVKSVLLDASAFDRKSASFPDPVARRMGREEAWKTLFQSENIELIIAPEAPGQKRPPLP